MTEEAKEKEPEKKPYDFGAFKVEWGITDDSLIEAKIGKLAQSGGLTEESVYSLLISRIQPSNVNFRIRAEAKKIAGK